MCNFVETPPLRSILNGVVAVGGMPPTPDSGDDSDDYSDYPDVNVETDLSTADWSDIYDAIAASQVSEADRVRRQIEEVEQELSQRSDVHSSTTDRLSSQIDEYQQVLHEMETAWSHYDEEKPRVRRHIRDLQEHLRKERRRYWRDVQELQRERRELLRELDEVSGEDLSGLLDEFDAD